MGNLKTLSISIPTYNRVELLDEILWIIGPQVARYKEECVCYVIDNNSDDHTRAIVDFHKKLWGEVIYIKNETNIGLICNIAKALVASEARWVWLLGDDDMPMPNAVKGVLVAINELEKNTDEAVLLRLGGAKLSSSGRIDTMDKPNQYSELKIYNPGLKIAEHGVHGLAWLSQLVINRKYWNQERFEAIFRPTDLYTFVRVLIEASANRRAAYNSVVSIIATDRGSRSYYYSKTAIARVCEFPEIERVIFDKTTPAEARKILRMGRQGWVLERASFVFKIAAFEKEYADQQTYIESPLSPFIEERVMIKLIYMLTRISLVRKLLRWGYSRLRKGNLQSLNAVNIAR